MRQMKSNHLLLTDIDGTFVYDSAQVESKDLVAFNKISEHFFTGIGTGRSTAEINHIEKVNNIVLDYKVAFNGALIVNKNNDILYAKTIEQEELLPLVDYLEKQQITFDALDGEIRFGNFKHENAAQLLGIEYHYIEDERVYSYARTKKIYKINLRPNNLEVAKNISDYLKQNFSGLSVFQVGKKRIEISAAQTSKGSALEKIATNKFKTITVGDSENDISMFKKADISYCMEHAASYVKKEATFVVPRFADAIYHLMDHQLEEASSL